ncbi:PocR ligand-binding domain-containing protein [Methanobacterium formicicum]|uniref:Two-component hybrid sensor and regulator n=1 Tax=Methanobacterium formicicum (strain DSM 3637 / PP1) TaxID=1204725 RepID=K2R030_METFP|nr:PocR ligand-binding domain-containing protein [Methanobacterium formicicum]EKF85878.1 two-component hybrid sensor and regulator [Methanobacterium formicicum DSM 3637]
MARILVNDNSSAARKLKDNLQIMGHQIIYTDFHGEKAAQKAEELKVDLFLMNIPSENFFQMESKNSINETILNSNTPIIPVIDLTKIMQSDYSPLKQVLASSHYGYLIKNDSEDYNLDYLKFAIELAIYKQGLITENNTTDNSVELDLKEDNSNLNKDNHLNDSSLNDELLKTFYDKIPLPYQSLNETGNFIEVNQAWLDTMGYSSEEVIGKWFGEFLAPDYVEMFKKEFPIFLSTGKFHSIELEMVKKDNSIINVFYEGKIEYYADGKFKKTQCIFKDITLSKKTEEALKESEEKFRTFIQQSLDGIVLLDEEGRVIEWNKGYEQISGIKKEEVLGKLFWEIKYQLTPPGRQTLNRLQHIMKLQLNALKTGEAPFLSKIHETEMIRPDGEIRYVEQLAFPIKTSTGYRIGYVTRDITQRKHMEEALEKRIVALSRPLDNAKEIKFQDLFNLKDIQEIQDLFAEATGVASIITKPDGTPITRPSKFCHLFDIMGKLEEDTGNPFKFDSLMGQNQLKGPIIKKCLNGSLWEAGANINVGGKHIANWLIGQVRDESSDPEQIRIYTQKIGADPAECIKAFLEIPVMSKKQFRKVSQVLFAFANQLSSLAYQNIQQTRFISERQQAEENLQKSLREKETLNQVITQLVGTSQTSEIYHIMGEAIKELLPSSYVIISGMTHDEKKINLVESFGFEKYLDEIRNILEIDLFKNKFPENLNGINNYFSGHLTESTEEVYNLAFRKMSPKTFRMIERVLNIGKVYNMGFYCNSHHYGGLSIALPKNQPLEHEETIETIVNQASMALQRSFAEKAIKESLEEKEVLLREIHHRVKNNMQIINSLLSLQSQHVEGEETMDVLKESQGRVRSMAMIHEKLYQSPNLTKIDFKDYIEKLASNLIYTYQVETRNIEQVFEVKDVEMNIDTAIPCGLIINELVTNSLKYAFPQSESNGNGIIKIELNQLEDQFKLVISDNGVGLPAHIQPENTETLGLQLVNSLVDQLEGTLEIDRIKGTKFTIIFSELNYKERI